MALGLMRHKQRLTRVTVRELLKVGFFFFSFYAHCFWKQKHVCVSRFCLNNCMLVGFGSVNGPKEEVKTEEFVFVWIAHFARFSFNIFFSLTHEQ